MSSLKADTVTLEQMRLWYAGEMANTQPQLTQRGRVHTFAVFEGRCVYELGRTRVTRKTFEADGRCTSVFVAYRS